MTAPFLSPGFRATDSDDNPLAGGYINFYAAGTTTPKAVYSDADLSTSLGTTVNLNSAGAPVSGSNTPVLIYPGLGDYKIRYYDADDTLVFEFDDYPGAVAEEEAATTATPVYPVVSKTTSYVVTSDDRGKLINANPTGGSFSITLPSAVTVGDNFLIGIRHNGTANAVSVLSTGSQNIRFQGNRTAFSLNGQGETLWLISDGSDWIASGYVPPSRKDLAPYFIVLDSLASPPSNPDSGARYLISGTPTGAWSTLGFADEDIAEADGNGSWIKHTPDEGWMAFDVDEKISLVFKNGAWENFQIDPGESTLKTFIVQDQKSSNTDGGTATTDAWTTAVLNTSVVNTITDASLASNKITLPAGRYRVRARKVFAVTGETRIRLKKDVAGTVVGLSESVHAGNIVSTNSSNATVAVTAALECEFEISESTDFILEYYVNVSQAGTSTQALGIPSNISGVVEVYATVTVEDIAAQQGPTGPQGLTGEGGLDASYAYQFNTATSGDPGTGKILVNNATPASVTQIAVHQTDANAAVLTAVIASWDDSTSSTKARIRFHKEGTPANFYEFLITGTGTDQGDYWTFPVSYVSHGGTISNGNDIAVLVVQTGDIGDPGTTVPDPSGLTVLDRTDLLPTHKIVAYDGATKALHPTFALRVFDVSDPEFGAVAGSTAVSAANVTAFQAASDAVDAAGGGTLYVPPGTWYIRSLITLHSNTVVLLAAGAIIKAHVASWTGDKMVFRNENHAASALTDENIHLEGFGLIDCDGMTADTHMWYMRYVDTSSVKGCIGRGGGNFTAFLACVDTLCDGAESQDTGNCGFDHWDGAGDAVVINCTVRGSAAQGIQATGTATDFANRDAWNVKFIGNTVREVRTGGVATAIIFNTADAGSTNTRCLSMGNYVDDCDIGLVMSGVGGQHTSIGDTFRDVDELPILIQDSGGLPDDCRIINPHLIDCDHDAGVAALIVIEGGDNHTVDGIRVTNAGAAPYDYVVSVAAGANDTYIGIERAPAGGTGTVLDAGTRTSYLNKIEAYGDWTAYTPTISASSGTITTSSATGAYKRIGKTMHFRVQVTITTNGTGSGFLIATLPADAVLLNRATGVGVRTGDGTQMFFRNAASKSNIYIMGMYDGAYPGSDGAIICVDGSYELD